MTIQLQEYQLLTDLYELTMAQSYFQEKHNDRPLSASSSGSIPPTGIFCFLRIGRVLRYLEEFSFFHRSARQTPSLRHLCGFLPGNTSKLTLLRRSEGYSRRRLFFRDEPVLEVTAPIIEAQLVETLIINQMNLQVLIASKACPLRSGSPGSPGHRFFAAPDTRMDAGMM